MKADLNIDASLTDTGALRVEILTSKTFCALLCTNFPYFIATHKFSNL